jgi:hypothetical protein
VDRHGREDRADESKRQREASTFDELPCDARLLVGGRGVQRAEDLHQLAFRALGSVDEREDSDEQRQQRDQREKDLVGDRAGEEGTVVRGEVVEDRTDARDSLT